MENSSLALAHGQSLVLDDGPLPQGFRILSKDGQVTLAVVMTSAGPVLQFNGGGLAIQAEGDLAVAARNISLHGEESVKITTGGSVNLRANDDVRLNGERVLVNC